MRRIQGNIGRDVTILDESKTSPILSHRVPIFPCILRKQDIQYYYYYLDHPSEMMNSLSEQKILKIDDTGNKFSKILGKYYETSFIHNSSIRSPRCNNRIRVVNNTSVRVSALVGRKWAWFLLLVRS